MKKKEFALLAAASMMMPLSAAAAQSAASTDQDSWRLVTGLTFSSGDYGEAASTDVFSVPTSLKYSRGAFRAWVTVPFVHVNGPGSLLQTPEGRDGSPATEAGGGGSNESGGGGSGNSGSGSSNSGSGSGSSGSGSGGSGSGGAGDVEVEDEDDDNSGPGNGDDDEEDDNGNRVASVVAAAADAFDNERNGIGDIIVGATYSFDLGAGFYFDPTARLKIPTASRAERLGSGEVDVTLSADLIKELDDVTVYATVRHRFAGDSDELPLENSWGASLGASLRVTSAVTFGVDYDWQQSSFAGGRSSREATGWGNFRLADRISLTVYALTGFNEASADFGAGASLSWRFD